MIKMITAILKRTMKLVIFLLSFIPTYAKHVISNTINAAGRFIKICLPAIVGALAKASIAICMALVNGLPAV